MFNSHCLFIHVFWLWSGWFCANLEKNYILLISITAIMIFPTIQPLTASWEIKCVKIFKLCTPIWFGKLQENFKKHEIMIFMINDFKICAICSFFICQEAVTSYMIGNCMVIGVGIKEIYIFSVQNTQLPVQTPYHFLPRSICGADEWGQHATFKKKRGGLKILPVIG